MCKVWVSLDVADVEWTGGVTHKSGVLKQSLKRGRCLMEEVVLSVGDIFSSQRTASEKEDKACTPRSSYVEKGRRDMGRRVNCVGVVYIVWQLERSGKECGKHFFFWRSLETMLEDETAYQKSDGDLSLDAHIKRRLWSRNRKTRRALKQKLCGMWVSFDV